MRSLSRYIIIVSIKTYNRIQNYNTVECNLYQCDTSLLIGDFECKLTIANRKVGVSNVVQVDQLHIYVDIGLKTNALSIGTDLIIYCNDDIYRYEFINGMPIAYSNTGSIISIEIHESNWIFYYKFTNYIEPRYMPNCIYCTGCEYVRLNRLVDDYLNIPFINPKYNYAICLYLNPPDLNPRSINYKNLMSNLVQCRDKFARITSDKFARITSDKFIRTTPAQTIIGDKLVLKTKLEYITVTINGIISITNFKNNLYRRATRIKNKICELD